MAEWSEAELRKKLSARQYEVLALVAQRFSSKEIGRQLGLSYKTVDNHVADLLVKMEVNARADAARIFLNAQRARERLPRETASLDGPVLPLPSMHQPMAPEHVKVRAEPGLTGSWEMLVEVFRLPPVGGRRNHLTTAQRLAKMAAIGLVSIVIVFAIVMVIVGIFALLKR